MTDDYVVVSTVQGQFDEAQLRAFLEAHGIPTQVRGEALRMTHGLTVDGLAAVEILVPRDQAEAARELIASAERGELRTSDDEADPSA
jgi:hypothetical protein